MESSLGLARNPVLSLSDTVGWGEGVGKVVALASGTAEGSTGCDGAGAEGVAEGVHAVILMMARITTIHVFFMQQFYDETQSPTGRSSGRLFYKLKRQVYCVSATRSAASALS